MPMSLVIQNMSGSWTRKHSSLALRLCCSHQLLVSLSCHSTIETTEVKSPSRAVLKSSQEGTTGRWTKAEHKRFLEALKLYGKNWKKVQEYVGTRTTTQARSHAQKYFSKLEQQGISCADCASDSLNGDPLVKDEEVPAAKAEPELAIKDTTKKRLKGPYSPGKRPIKCDSFINANTKLLAPASKREKIEPAVVDNPTNFQPDSSEYEDKSIHLPLNESNERSNISEPDFEVIPAENIQPLDLEGHNNNAADLDNDAGVYKSTGVDLSALLLEEPNND